MMPAFQIFDNFTEFYMTAIYILIIYRSILAFRIRSYWVPGWWEEVWAACLQGLYDSRRGRCELATLREDADSD